MKKSLWNEEYYESLEYYYWEPQQLGKKKNPDTKYDSLAKVLSHVRKLEVSLNHHFNTFFSLLPNTETRSLFSHLFGKEFEGNFCFNSKATREFVGLFRDTTQPDLFFPAEEELVAIELKVGKNKSDFDQFMKYLLLSCLENERSGKKKRYSLLFLGEGNFETTFKEKCETIEELRSRFLNYEIGEKTKNGAIVLSPYREEIYSSSQNIDIQYCSYGDFYGLLKKLHKETENEALQNIYNGMLGELKQRGYAISVS